MKDFMVGVVLGTALVGLVSAVPVTGVEQFYARYRLALQIAGDAPMEAVSILQPLVAQARTMNFSSAQLAEMHYNYGAALHNASLGSHARSAIERVALAKQALAEFETAAKMSPMTQFQRSWSSSARVLALWGFPYEASIAESRSHEAPAVRRAF